MINPYVAGFGNSLVLKNIPDSMLAMIETPPLVKGEDGTYVGSMNDYSQEDRIKLIQKLRDLGFAFSFGRDWAPSEIFELFRDKGLVSGSYKRISWTGPNKYVIEDR